MTQQPITEPGVYAMNIAYALVREAYGGTIPRGNFGTAQKLARETGQATRHIMAGFDWEGVPDGCEEEETDEEADEE